MISKGWLPGEWQGCCSCEGKSLDPDSAFHLLWQCGACAPHQAHPTLFSEAAAEALGDEVSDWEPRLTLSRRKLCTHTERGHVCSTVSIAGESGVWILKLVGNTHLKFFPDS